MSIYDYIFFLLRDGQSLSDNLCEILLHTAQQMLQTGQRRQHAKGLDGMVFVDTQFKSASLAGLSGTEFEADVAAANGKRTKVRFIVRPAPQEFLEAKRMWITLHVQFVGPQPEAEASATERFVN